MADIRYLTGDATAPAGGGNKIICHVCNDVGGWGKGFVLALSKRWPQPEAAFRQWYHDREGSDFALGAVQIVQVEPETWVANMVGQHGLKPAGGTPPIRYEAVETALSRVAEEAAKLKASVHMPRIGCGLAGGTWDQIEPIIRRTLCGRGVDVCVYDLG
jgi:O-acetyl-ADP-ribose deacetylase (regulator of RNase III)